MSFGMVAIEARYSRSFSASAFEGLGGGDDRALDQRVGLDALHEHRQAAGIEMKSIHLRSLTSKPVCSWIMYSAGTSSSAIVWT
jgi:hypothetical protein